MAEAYFWTPQFDCEWIPAARGIPRSKQKVMIVLHGRGDSIDSYREINDELGIPHMNYLLLNAPRRSRDGFSWFALEPRHKRGVRAVREKLFHVVDELKNFGWQSKDIYWLGHSQGCLVAADLALNHPDVFGGVVGVSGYVWFFRGWRQRARLSGALKTPWLFTHGTRDQVILPAEIREDVEELTAAEVPVHYAEFKKGHDFDFTREVPFIRRWIGGARARRLLEATGHKSARGGSRS